MYNILIINIKNGLCYNHVGTGEELQKGTNNVIIFSKANRFISYIETVPCAQLETGMSHTDQQ